MNAIKFVNKFGLGKAKGIVAVMIDGTVNYGGESVGYSDLKQIVDAWELVERFGDLRQSKLNLEHMISHNQFEFCATNIDELQNAINLVEQCL